MCTATHNSDIVHRLNWHAFHIPLGFESRTLALKSKRHLIRVDNPRQNKGSLSSPNSSMYPDYQRQQFNSDRVKQPSQQVVLSVRAHTISLLRVESPQLFPSTAIAPQKVSKEDDTRLGSQVTFHLVK